MRHLILFNFIEGPACRRALEWLCGLAFKRIDGKRLLNEFIFYIMVYEVGKFYKVKCVELLSWTGHLIEVIPVIGEPHRDPQFGSDTKHYHIDGRFLPSDSYISHVYGKTNMVIWCKDDRYPLSNYAGKEVVRRMKCERENTGILPPKNGKYQEWYDSFIGKSCKGKKCPHLGQEMIEENGVLVCPLHSLKGCPKSEFIIPYF